MYLHNVGKVGSKEAQVERNKLQKREREKDSHYIHASTLLGGLYRGIQLIVFVVGQL